MPACVSPGWSSLCCLGCRGAARGRRGAPRPVRGAGEDPPSSAPFRVSPDGRRVAFALATPDVEANLPRSAVWIVGIDGGEARRLTSGDKRDSDPRFSPDGRRLAFLSNRDGGSQIWTIDLSGGDPVKATSFPTGVNGFTWSPDGKSFVFASDVFPDCADVACLEKTRKDARGGQGEGAGGGTAALPALGYVEGRHADRTCGRCPAAGGAAVDLTPGDRDAPPFSVGGGKDWDVSPDGRDLVYASNPDEDEALSTNADLWVVPFAGGGPPRNLTASNPAFDGSPRFSPDGRWIAFRSQRRPGFEADRFRLMFLDRATGQTRGLTDAFDFWVEDFRWAPDSKSLVFSSEVRGREMLYRVSLAGGAPAPLWTRRHGGGARGHARAASSSAPAPCRAPRRSGQPDPDGRGAAPLTHVNDALFRELALGEVSERFTDVLRRPQAAGLGREAAVLRSVEEVPRGSLHPRRPAGRVGRTRWSYRWNPQVWAAYGYVVYAANPRGSTGFGQELRRRDQRRLGRPGLRRPDAAGRRPRIVAIRRPREDRGRGRVLRRIHGQLDRRAHRPLPGPRVARRHLRSRIRQAGDRGALVPDLGVQGLAVELGPLREVEPDAVCRQLQDPDPRHHEREGLPRALRAGAPDVHRAPGRRTCPPSS